MRVLVIAEYLHEHITQGTLVTLGAALQLSKATDVLIAGKDIAALAKNLSQYQGVAKVICVDKDCYSPFLAENGAPLIAELGEGYTHILAPASTFGKNLMPRVAALKDVAQISDVIGIESEDTFMRPIYAGNAIECVQSKDNLKVLTIRPTAFEAVSQVGEAAPIEAITTLAFSHDGVQFVSEETPELTRPELSSAKIVISGGRGLQSAENFKMIESVADKLHAAIGATRAAVDAGFVPNDYQVGQTGKIVAPDLYIAVGISGAIQHLAGMKDSKVIVAINKDEDAPIFQVADYGLVGDLFQILPDLENALG